jgi:hypothetical protein
MPSSMWTTRVFSGASRSPRTASTGDQASSSFTPPLRRQGNGGLSPPSGPAEHRGALDLAVQCDHEGVEVGFHEADLGHPRPVCGLGYDRLLIPLGSVGDWVLKDVDENPALKALGVGAGRASHGHDRFPQRPPACSSPGVVGKADGPPEDLPLVTDEVGPGHDEVTGGVADAAGTEVDDRGQFSVGGEQVADGDVTVEPRRRGRPGRGQRARPDGLAGSDIDDIPELAEGALDLVAVDAGVTASEAGMTTSGRPLLRGNLPERGQKVPKIARQLGPVDVRGALDSVSG